MIYSGSVPVSSITWSSDDDKVASIKDGKVVAVGPGMTNVHGEYGGQKVSCIIRCDFKDDSSGGITGNGGGVTEDGGGMTSGGNYGFYSQYGVIASNDTTISVGDSLQLSLRDGAGNPVSVTFTVSGTSCAMDGNTVTGSSTGTSTVSCVYQGVTYTCTVRVNE